MADFNPFVLRRMLALRQFSMLADAELSGLALLAGNVAEVRLPPGTVIATAGAPLAAIHLVLDGEIATPGAAGGTWGPGQAFGALEVLAHREATARAVTTTATTTFQLLAPDVADILEDSFGMMRTTLRRLAAHTFARGGPSDAEPLSPPGASGLVERLIAFRQQRAFASAPLEALVALAHATEEVALPAGAIVTEPGQPCTSIRVVVEGTLRATRGQRAARTLGPGHVIGHLEVLGALDHADTIEVTTAARVLETAAIDLFDVLEDHGELGRAILAVLAGDLLPPPARSAAS